MKLRTIFLGLTLSAAPMQASIIASMTDPGYTLLQNFATSSPSLTPNTVVSGPSTAFTGVGVTTSFVNVTSAATYDCTTNFGPDSSCITNFTVDGGDNYATVTGNSLTFSLNTPVKKVAFYSFFDSGSFNTIISVYDTTHTLIESLTVGPLATNSPNWYTATEGINIGSVTIQGTNSNPLSAAPSPYGMIVAHVETSAADPAPEPGTITMLSLGVGAIGFFARRRKA
jgi:hypothetical protein